MGLAVDDELGIADDDNAGNVGEDREFGVDCCDVLVKGGNVLEVNMLDGVSDVDIFGVDLLVVTNATAVELVI